MNIDTDNHELDNREKQETNEKLIAITIVNKFLTYRQYFITINTDFKRKTEHFIYILLQVEYDTIDCNKTGVFDSNCVVLPDRRKETEIFIQDTILFTQHKENRSFYR